LCPRWGTVLHKLNNLRGSIKIVQLLEALPTLSLKRR
jgi:hypothetical protein